MNLDLIPADATGLGAAIGLMSAPGPGCDLDENLAALRDDHRCGLLVSLTGDAELDILGIADLVERCTAIELPVLRFPIANYSTPDTADELCAVVATILATARSGSTVVIHCWAGCGRSGLVAACCLAARGLAPDEAIETVRRYRWCAIETLDQEEYVHDFARRWEAAAL